MDKKYFNKLSLVLIDNLIALAYAICKTLKSDNAFDCQHFYNMYQDMINHIIDSSLNYK